MARVQLNDNQLEQVSGGAFNFYKKDDQNQCYVDGMGTFNCSADASNWVLQRMATTGAPVSTVIAEAVEKGLFWK